MARRNAGGGATADVGANGVGAQPGPRWAGAGAVARDRGWRVHGDRADRNDAHGRATGAGFEADCNPDTVTAALPASSQSDREGNPAMNRWLVLILLSAALALPVLPVHAELPVHAVAPVNLFEAAKGGTADEVKAALAAGADVGARTEGGWTPLHVAARNPNPAVIKALLEAGADPDARTEDGVTPLHSAAVWNVNPAVITALIEGGADPDARTEGGTTPLHSAASIRWYDGGDGNLISGFGNPSAITALIEGGANPGARNEYGATPLHWAAFVLKRRNHSVERYNTNPSEVVAVIKALLEGGADPGAPDYDVKTPFDYAKENEALKGTDAYWLLNEARFE